MSNLEQALEQTSGKNVYGKRVLKCAEDLVKAIERRQKRKSKTAPALEGQLAHAATLVAEHFNVYRPWRTQPVLPETVRVEPNPLTLKANQTGDKSFSFVSGVMGASGTVSTSTTASASTPEPVIPPKTESKKRSKAQNSEKGAPWPYGPRAAEPKPKKPEDGNTGVKTSPKGKSRNGPNPTTGTFRTWAPAAKKDKVKK